MKHYKLIKEMPGYSYFKVGMSYSENYNTYTSANSFLINPTSPKVEELILSYPDHWQYDGDYDIIVPKYSASDFGW